MSITLRNSDGRKSLAGFTMQTTQRKVASKMENASFEQALEVVKALPAADNSQNLRAGKFSLPHMTKL